MLRRCNINTKFNTVFEEGCIGEEGYIGGGRLYWRRKDYLEEEGYIVGEEGKSRSDELFGTSRVGACVEGGWKAISRPDELLSFLGLWGHGQSTTVSSFSGVVMDKDLHECDDRL